MTNLGPDDHDADLFDDGGDVIDCPHCGEEIYAYAEKCPACGTWLQMRHRQVKGFERKRYMVWPWVVLALVAAIVLFWAGAWEFL